MESIVRGSSLNQFLDKQNSASLAISLIGHIAIFLFLALFSDRSATQFVAAGPGEGGGGGEAIEVGLVEPSGILGFSRPQAASTIGNQVDEINNAPVETEQRSAEESEAELILKKEEAKPDLRAIKTDRPTTGKKERIYSSEIKTGASASSSIMVGTTSGSPIPQIQGGIGVGTGAGAGLGTGLPGGSEYGRRIQLILGRNFNPPRIPNIGDPQFVVILLRISRDGNILSIQNGRVAPIYIKRSSPYPLLNNAAERAILASNPLPPFPAGFLAGSSEAVAEVWFKYPK